MRERPTSSSALKKRLLPRTGSATRFPCSRRLPCRCQAADSCSRSRCLPAWPLRILASHSSELGRQSVSPALHHNNCSPQQAIDRRTAPCTDILNALHLKGKTMMNNCRPRWNGCSRQRHTSTWQCPGSCVPLVSCIVLKGP